MENLQQVLMLSMKSAQHRLVKARVFGLEILIC